MSKSKYAMEWHDPKKELPEVPEGYHWAEVLCLYRADCFDICKVMQYFPRAYASIRCEAGWHDPYVFDRIDEDAQDIYAWAYLPEPPSWDGAIQK